MRHNVNDALSYLDLVKERFEGQGPTYLDFLDVMREYKAQTIDTNMVISRVRELFKDHPDLIGGFNSFIPEGYCMEGSAAQIRSSATLDDMSTKAEIEVRSPSKSNSDNKMTIENALHFAHKVKNRFKSSPEVYETFLQILNWYQNELKDNDLAKRQLAEKKVSKEFFRLFEGHSDLLKDFNKFLSDPCIVSGESTPGKRINMSSPTYSNKQKTKGNDEKGHKSEINRMKRGNNFENPVSQSPSLASKKSKMVENMRDVSISDFTKIGNSTDLNVLQKIYEAFRNKSINSQSYTCLLQNIQLYNNNMITKEDLLEACRPLFSNQHIDLWRQLRDLLNNSKSAEVDKNAVQSMYEKRFDLDLTKLKKCGASYKILPYDYPQPICTGRATCSIAREVLNDNYISFASLASEDSQFVASKKNQYEESIYRVEDERYEVDMVVELNKGAMQSLIAVKHTMEKMSREELQKFEIDECLGGTSAILMKKAIHRVYGEKANEVIVGLRRCPKTVVNVVISRMKQKEAEWKEAIKSYQRVWSDQDSRNYLKSLDHQGAVFKQKDYPLIKNKNFINQVEVIAFGDRAQVSQQPTSSDPINALIAGSLHLVPVDSLSPLNPSPFQDLSCLTNVGPLLTPIYRMNQTFTASYGSHLINVFEGTGHLGSAHLVLKFPDNDVYCSDILEDASNLIIHHVKRQTNSSKEDKKEMKFLIRSVIQDLFQNDHFPQSDDEEEEDDDEGDDQEGNRPGKNTPSNGSNESASGESSNKVKEEGDEEDNSSLRYCNSKFTKKNTDKAKNIKEESYSLFYGNNHWYCLIRLYHLLVSRLDLLKKRGEILSMEAAREAPTTIQAAEVLRLRKLYPLEPSKYYRRALSHVKDLLDGAEDISSYEDHLRDMFGIYAYPWFTMDRLISNIVKQLHTVACNDPLSEKLTNLYLNWNATYCQKNTRQNKSRTLNIGVSGSIRTRIERLSDEVEYSCEVMQAFANDSNLNLSELAPCSNSNHPDSTTNLSTPVNNTGSQSQTTNPPNSGNTTTPSTNQNGSNGTEQTNNNEQNSVKATSNCYPMVVMKKSSLILIRLIEPFAASGKKRIGKNGQKNGEKSFQGLAQLLQEQSRVEAKCYSSYKKFVETPETECFNWLDYIIRYLLNLKMYSSEKESGEAINSVYSTPTIIALASRIRPVLLFRNVRKCVKALSSNFINRKKTETILETDQKETVVEKMILSEGEETLEKKEDEKGQGPDYHKLMRTIFKSELTKEELFRNTLNTDYMQLNRDGVKGNSPSYPHSNKSYKINWSVGSYGIFYRKKSSPSNIDHSVKRKRFHAFLESKLPSSKPEEEPKPEAP